LKFAKWCFNMKRSRDKKSSSVWVDKFFSVSTREYLSLEYLEKCGLPIKNGICQSRHFWCNSKSRNLSLNPNSHWLKFPVFSGVSPYSSTAKQLIQTVNDGIDRGGWTNVQWTGFVTIALQDLALIFTDEI
jgi:hypothetical protein